MLLIKVIFKVLFNENLIFKNSHKLPKKKNNGKDENGHFLKKGSCPGRIEKIKRTKGPPNLRAAKGSYFARSYLWAEK